MTSNRRLPFVTTLHGTDITLVGVDRSYFPITRFSIEQSDGVTAISQYLQAKTVEVFGVANEIRVIHNFVNCDLYRPAPDRRPKEKRLIHLSNFRPVKRVLDCVRILNEVRRSTAAHLLMVGDGPERGPAETLARELGLTPHVSFLGKRDHVERLLPEAHVMLLPSEMEAFGLAALEAMACGVPPVATQTGGVPELVTDSVDGYLEPVGDVAAQAARVVQLLTDDTLYDRMSAAARRTAETRFASSMIIPQYEQHYREVCDRR
jgi:N-acetyl-alpha-D-glucosaminyl L-malate synthase BshA